MHPWVKRIRYRFEYGLACVGVGMARVLPVRLASFVVRGAADLCFLCMPMRRRVAIENILGSGITTDRRQAARTAAASFRHFAVSAVETLAFSRLMEDGTWREHVEIKLSPALEEELRADTRGLVLASGHFGNWQIGGSVFSQYRPLVGVARPLDNPDVERMLTKLRWGARFRSMPKHGSDVYRFLAVLKQHEALALMIDQHGGLSGMVVDFLGRPASTHTVVALLPLVTRLPLYFGHCVRTGPMRFEVGAVGPLDCRRTGRKEDDIRRILGALNAELETLIRAHPEQYMWGHRRWVANRRPHERDAILRSLQSAEARHSR